MWFCVFIWGELHDLFTIFVTIQMNAKAEEATKIRMLNSLVQKDVKRVNERKMCTWTHEMAFLHDDDDASAAASAVNVMFVLSTDFISES